MDPCEFYWESSDWLPPGYILERWCQVDDRPCLEAKLQALLSACERGDVGYRRRDGKDFDDPVHELWSRRILLIERASFEAWVTALEGKSPLSIPPGPETHSPAVTATPPSREASAIQPKSTEVVAIPGAPESPPLAVSSVTSEAIIAAFRIHADADSNRH